MGKKKLFIIIIFFFIILAFLYINNLTKDDKNIKKEEITEIKDENSDDIFYNSNIIEDVYYSSKDSKGNEYIIEARQGEIDYKKNNIIYLTNVKGLVKLTNLNDIEITSNYGRYDTDNFDTIFSKNVIINYLDNKISGEYLDFSVKRDSMIISRNVIYTNLENILKADVIEINIRTKDTKIFMYQNNEKVNIKSK